MLVTKRFYCLFPLACIVLHSIMFSMVRAPPMDNLGLELPDLNLMSQADTDELLDLSLVPNMVASSSHPMPLGQAQNSLEGRMAYPITKEGALALAKDIQHLQPSGSSSYIMQINNKKLRMYDFGQERGHQILNEFFEKFKPFEKYSEIMVDPVPLFFISRDGYFLSKNDDESFQVFYKSPKRRLVTVFGKTKLGLAREDILG